MQKARSDQLESLARVFAALSNPHRLWIFMQLATCCRPGTACEHGEEAVCRQVGELGAHLEIAPSTISHHLKELRDAGLVKSRRRGQCTECWVDPDILRALSEFFSTPLG